MDRYQKEFRADGLERFTLYWRHGERQVIKGKTIEEAFANAGYGGGAVAAVDWYDKGISETHHWSGLNKEWVKYEPIHVHYDDVLAGIVSPAEVLVLLKTHHSVIVELKDKSQFILEFKFGKFYKVDWLHYIELVFGEYHQGSYTDDPDEDHYFMTAGTEYFDPAQPEKAVEAFFKRIKEPAKSLGMGLSLEEIKHTQTDL